MNATRHVTSFGAGLALVALISSSEAEAQGRAFLNVTVEPVSIIGQPVTSRDGFTVCIGNSSDRDAAGRLTTSPGGTVNFAGLTTGATLLITVSRAGYNGSEVISRLGGIGNTATVPIRASRLASGGPRCPDLAATPGTDPVFSVAVLGEERLPERGNFTNNADPMSLATLDCARFGPNFTMVGIEGRHGEAVDNIRVLCSPVGSNGALGTTVSKTVALGGDKGTAYTRRCDAGKVVVRIGGVMNRNQLRLLQLDCATLLSTALTNGSFSQTLQPVGQISGTTFGPDACNNGRSGRALRAKKDIFDSGIPMTAVLSPWVIASIQLICQQPNIR